MDYLTGYTKYLNVYTRLKSFHKFLVIKPSGTLSQQVPLQTVKCEEDDEFIAELERTMTSELTGRKMDSTVNKVNSSDLALPMNRGFKGLSQLPFKKCTIVSALHLNFKPLKFNFFLLLP